MYVYMLYIHNKDKYVTVCVYMHKNYPFFFLSNQQTYICI